MALNAAQLEDLILSNLDEAGFNTTGAHAQIMALANAIAEAVVKHITTQAEVYGSAGVIYPVK